MLYLYPSHIYAIWTKMAFHRKDALAGFLCHRKSMFLPSPSLSLMIEDSWLVGDQIGGKNERKGKKKVAVVRSME